MPKTCLLFALLLLCAAFTRAQSNKPNSGALLYLHTDKTVYTNNEEVWFSGYLIRSGGINIATHKFMVVSLARQDDNKIIVHQKFIMEDGFSNGNIHLPDSIPPGNYKLIAYTNLVDKYNKPLDVFTQHLSIRSGNLETITASISLQDTVADKNGNYHVLLFAQPKTINKRIKPEVTYHIGNNNAAGVEQDLLGKYEMLIPAKNVTPLSRVLYAAVKYGNEFKYLSIKLPVPTPKLIVKFYPEGGNLTAGMLNTMGIEARIGTTPINYLYGVLLRNGLPVDTVQTNAMGLATFKFYHDAGSSYTFKILKAKGTTPEVFMLPPAINTKLVLNMQKAVCDDTARFKVLAAAPQKVHIIVRDKQQEYFSFYHVVHEGKNDFAIDLQAISKGGATITVLDSLERPVAERLFFAHYNRQVIAEIKTDKKSYAKREKVNVTITLKDAITRQPVDALLSVACVQGNRLEPLKQKDIESYTYLYHDLADTTLNAQQVNLKNKADLENNLLIRGWRRYTWQDTIRQTDTAFNTLQFSGNVTKNKEQLTKAVLLNIYRKDGIVNIPTDTTGYYKVATDFLYAPYDNKLFMFTTAVNKEQLRIKFNDPYEVLSNSVVQNSPSIIPMDYRMDASSAYMVDELKKTKQLKQVNIKAKPIEEYWTKRVNECGDYVCFNNILNCFNHPYGRPAVIGEYYFNPRSRVEKQRYKGCAEEDRLKWTIRIDGIYAGREFYGLSASDLEVSIPQYVSTLFWNPAMVVKGEGTTSFSFYNSDVSGSFKIVIQGIAAQSVVSGIQGYTVAD